jgi:hypothetical protein
MLDEREFPHWARVALVARCARIVLPFFDGAWPNAPAKRRDGLLAGIFSCERSAADARLADDHSEADREATMTCGALRAYVYISRGQLKGTIDERDEFPADITKAIIASQVAAVVAMGTETARADPSESFPIAMGALSWAHSVAEDDPAVLNSLRREFSELKRAVAKGKWTHATPVIWTTSGWKTTKASN